MSSQSFFAFTFSLALAGASVWAQAPTGSPAQAPSLQAAQDPRYAEVIARCKTPPPAPAAAPARQGGPAAPPAAAPAATSGPAAYTVAEIPGVIAAGQQWTKVWETTGNNADGIVGLDDGTVLVAQNSNAQVVKIDQKGTATVLYRDTRTGGSLAMNKKGELFIAERALNPAIRQLTPTRRLVADRINGDTLDCLGGVLNDIAADSKGGVYFTMGGLFYADAKGTVTRYGENLRTNGLILSADEKTLYVTNGDTVARFDVQPDGSLTNQREFAKLPFGGGDGSTIDAAGRLYVTAGAAVHVIAPDGKYLGNIPAPYGLIATAFGGPDKKTLYAVASLRDPNRQGIASIVGAQLIAIPMQAQGYKGRAK
jgi:sugar lactone lactonase YvrE